MKHQKHKHRSGGKEQDTMPTPTTDVLGNLAHVDPYAVVSSFVANFLSMLYLT